MRIVYASLLLSLSACMIIGDPKDPNESDSGTTGPDGTGTATTGTATTTTGDGTTTGATDGTTGTTDPAPTTGLVTTTAGTDCAGLDELGCGTQAGCRAVYGVPFDFPGCTPLPAFLACIEDMGCGAAETVVCRDNSLEVYLLPDTCIPPDFSECETMLQGCGDGCLGLDEAACGEDPNCSPHYGAPHVMQGDMVCADFGNQQFLACDKLKPPCPPAVVTVCPIGQPDTAFDVASGCTPPGYESCMGGPIGECP